MHSIILLSEIGCRAAPLSLYIKVTTNSWITGTEHIIMITTKPATPIEFFSSTPAPITVSATLPIALPTPGSAEDALKNTERFTWSATGTINP